MAPKINAFKLNNLTICNNCENNSIYDKKKSLFVLTIGNMTGIKNVNAEIKRTILEQKKKI